MVLKDYVFQKRQFLTLYDMILASSSSGGWMGVSMMLSIIYVVDSVILLKNFAK